MESGNQLKESGIQLTIGIRNPSSTDEGSAIQVPLTRNPKSSDKESKAWNPEFKILLDNLTRGATLLIPFPFYYGFPRLKNVRIYSGEFVTRHVPAFLEGEAFC